MALHVWPQLFDVWGGSTGAGGRGSCEGGGSDGEISQ
jgi:hypothetical protein